MMVKLARPYSTPLCLGQLQPYIQYNTYGDIIVQLATWDIRALDLASLTSEHGASKHNLTLSGSSLKTLISE